MLMWGGCVASMVLVLGKVTSEDCEDKGDVSGKRGCVLTTKPPFSFRPGFIFLGLI